MDVVTVTEAAMELKISPAAVYKAVAEGRLPALRFGSSIRILREDLVKYVVRPWAPVPAGTKRTPQAAA
jgi:excisionase family DNA binding protein